MTKHPHVHWWTKLKPEPQHCMICGELKPKEPTKKITATTGNVDKEGNIK